MGICRNSSGNLLFGMNKSDLHQLPLCFAQDKFSACKAKEGVDAVASLTDDNEADGNSDKRNIWFIGAGHTRNTDGI